MTRHAQVRAALAGSEDVEKELERAISILLVGTGFDGVNNDAFASLTLSTEEFMTRFSQRVHRRMQHCRRSEPVPSDFEYGLEYSLSSLLDELDLTCPPQLTQAPVVRTATSIACDFHNLPNLGKERKIKYIPKHFPPIPSQHTYVDTSVYTDRETDTLKIREKAMHEGEQAEQALRKLMVAHKAPVPIDDKLFLEAVRSLGDSEEFIGACNYERQFRMNR